MFVLMISIFLIYSLAKKNKNKEYSLFTLFKKYEKVPKVKYKTRRSRGLY